MTRLRHEDYEVGLICALQDEFTATRRTLDESHEDLPQKQHDTTAYALGRVGQHNVVIACLPAGFTGTVSAAGVARDMVAAFPNIRFGLMVGIGGGVPSSTADIRLGDVVVGKPGTAHGGVLNYRFGKSTPNGFERTGFLNAPPLFLLSAVNKLGSNVDLGESKLPEYLSKICSLPKFSRVNAAPDILFEAESGHTEGDGCDSCKEERKSRQKRPDETPRVFYGAIASADEVMRDSKTRDDISQQLGGVLCFEMEAAGLVNKFPCLVVRGICDYADAHKNKTWQPYAAAAAAAYAKDLLMVIPREDVAQTQTVRETTRATRADYEGSFSYSSQAPVKAFVPRPYLRDQIRTQLCDGDARKSTNTIIVWGLGGAGKTQLVLDYVQQYEAEYEATFWIEAGQKESLERDFVSLHQTLYGSQMLAGQETISVESAVIGVKSWFSGRRGPWLIVLDGVDSIENPKASGFIDIKHFIPNVPSLHAIVTSRSATAKDMTQLEGVYVGEMDEAQAVELFFKYSGLQRSDRDVKSEITAIVQELGYLALAITLAGTYLRRTRSDIKAYLSNYKRRRRELLARKPEILVHQYSASILTTWETSYQGIMESQCPQALTLLKTIPFLSSDDIFLRLFRTLPLDDQEIEECLATLEGFSLLQWREDQQSYSMHKLVHAWGYDRLTEEEQHEFSVAACVAIERAVKSRGTKPEEGLRLVPHVMANFSLLGFLSSTSDKTTADTLSGLGRLRNFLIDVGRYPEARIIQEFVFVERRRILGEEHPETIRAMGNFAITLSKQGQLDDAARMMNRVLEKLLRILGEEHPDTTRAIHNLAKMLSDQGQQDEPARMLKEVLEKSRRTLGEEHLDTIRTMNNLASRLREQGQLDEAARMAKDVLEKRRRILGEEHPDTIKAIGNLSNLLYKQGQLGEASRMMKGVLEKMQHILGEEHPDTIKAMASFAITLSKQGQLDEAVELLEVTTQKMVQINGADHPDTKAATRHLNVLAGERARSKKREIDGGENRPTKTSKSARLE